jgi:hypothetical protein
MQPKKDIKKMEATHEILTTKDKKNVLQFHNDKYFMDKNGVLKNKYFKALHKLYKDKIIKLNAEFNKNTNQWDFYWSFIG